MVSRELKDMANMVTVFARHYRKPTSSHMAVALLQANIILEVNCTACSIALIVSKEQFDSIILSVGRYSPGAVRCQHHLTGAVRLDHPLHSAAVTSQHHLTSPTPYSKLI